MQWEVMVRTVGEQGTTFQWRRGCVYTLAPMTIVLDGADSNDIPTPNENAPNVVVDFGGKNREMLSLRIDNFHDGMKGAGFCWFRIQPTAAYKRDRLRASIRARRAFETRRKSGVTASVASARVCAKSFGHVAYISARVSPL